MSNATLSVYWADLTAEQHAKADLSRLSVPLRPYRTTHLQRLSKLSKWLLQYALHERPPHPAEPLAELRYHVNGKPYLPNSHYSFSLSHSGQLAACVVASQGPVGIDIQEQVRLRPGIERLFLSSTERERTVGEDTLALWSQKEAAFKAFGHELNARLTDFRFEQTHQLRCRDLTVKLHPLSTQTGYIGYVAYAADDDPITVQIDSL